MVSQRQRIQTSKRMQSQRRIWFRVSNYEPSYGTNVRGEKVLLEQENSTNNQDKKEKKEVIG
jgi:hypothetical protein